MNKFLAAVTLLAGDLTFDQPPAIESSKTIPRDHEAAKRRAQERRERKRAKHLARHKK